MTQGLWGKIDRGSTPAAHQLFFRLPQRLSLASAPRTRALLSLRDNQMAALRWREGARAASKSPSPEREVAGIAEVR